MTGFYLGVDPGRDKTGLSLVDEQGLIKKVLVVPTVSLEEQVLLLSAEAGTLVIGNGTHSREIVELIKKLLPGKSLVVVDEKHSTEEARRLYWQEHPPEGLRRMLPLGLQFPPEPLDGYAAAILVRRHLATLK